MRDEPSREVSRSAVQTSDIMEPCGGSAGNGAETLSGSDAWHSPNSEIGIDYTGESDRRPSSDLATNLKDNGADDADESDRHCGPNGETGIDSCPECEPSSGPDLVTNLKNNGADRGAEGENPSGPNGEIGTDSTTGSEMASGPDLATILSDLGETSRHWRANVKMRTRTTNAIEGKAKEAAVWRLRAAGTPLPEGKMPKPIKADYETVHEVYPEWVDFVAKINIPIKRDVKTMDRLVKLTPFAPWVKSVKGLGELGIGHMLGMIGNPDKYPHYRMMVKGLGIAPRDAYPLSKNGKHMVPGQRRGIMLFNVIDPLLRNNNGKYREIYYVERARQIELHPEMDRGISEKTGKQQIAQYGDNVARMKVASVLISDMWHEWRAAKVGVNAIAVVPPSKPLDMTSETP